MSQVFLDLAKYASTYMSPSRNRRFPRTPCYTFYELSSPPYNNTSPYWRERREEVFARLREATELSTVSFLCYCETNEASFGLPIQSTSHATYGFGFIENGGSFLATTKESNYRFALRALAFEDPVLQKWGENKFLCTYPDIGKLQMFGNLYTTTPVLRAGSKFFYFEMANEKQD